MAVPTASWAGHMSWLQEADWRVRSPVAPSVWVRRGRVDTGEPPAAMRVVRNDVRAGDRDDDGAGTGLENAVQTCDAESDVLRLGSPLPLVRFDCSQLVRALDVPVSERLQDTDQDGHTDAEEILGRRGPDGGIVRWGANPHHKDLFVEVDLSDYVDPVTDGNCGGDPRDRNLWAGRLPGGTFLRDFIVDSYAASRSRLAEPAAIAGPREPIPHWSSPDGGGGVALHLDLGPVPVDPSGTPVASPFDTRYFDAGGGGTCVPAKVRPPGCSEDSCLEPMTRFRARREYMHSGRRPFVHYMVAVGGAGQTNIRGRESVYGASQRGTFVHELGHQIGLDHWGPVDRPNRLNYKPNYFSRMNYRYQDATYVPGRLLFSEGDFRAFPISLQALDECAPLGERDLSYLDNGGHRTSLLVCGLPGRAACVSPTGYADFDWDGDDFIGDPATGRLPTAPHCPPRSSLQAVRRVAGVSGSHVTRGAGLINGHAAAGIPTYADPSPSSALGGVSLALMHSSTFEELLLLGFIDTRQHLNVASSRPLNAGSCPDSTDVPCGLPNREFDAPGRSVVRDYGGGPVHASHAALLELRAEHEMLVVYGDPKGTLLWGYLQEGFATYPYPGLLLGWVFKPKGLVGDEDLHAPERVSLARDDTGEVVMLATDETGRVVEGSFDVATETWDVTLPSLGATSGDLPVSIPWVARGAVGATVWRHSEDLDRTFYSGYAAASTGQLELLRRQSFGQWRRVGCSPFREGDIGWRSVSLGVSEDAERLWAIWGKGDGGMTPGENPTRSSLRTASAIPAPAGTTTCNPEIDSEFANSKWVRELGPAALLWDDRGRLGDGSYSGLRVAWNAPAPCDRCYHSDDFFYGHDFWSDGAPAGEHNPDDACDTFYCTDDLDAPNRDGGFIQSAIRFNPFFDPADVRVTFRDFEDYDTAGVELCRWVEGATGRCPPLPTVHSLPSTRYLTFEDMYGPVDPG